MTMVTLFKEKLKSTLVLPPSCGVAAMRQFKRHLSATLFRLVVVIYKKKLNLSKLNSAVGSGNVRLQVNIILSFYDDDFYALS